MNTLKPAQKHIQDKMIELFTKCDADYGRRVAEGLRNTPSTNEKGPIGSTKTGEAVKEAEEKSHPAKPY